MIFNKNKIRIYIVYNKLLFIIIDMKKILNNYRKFYKKRTLLEYEVPKNPILLFHRWFLDIKNCNLKNFEINAMSISTIKNNKYVENRIVLLKEYNDKGFIFFSNYNSRKAKSISLNNNVCLLFYWPFLERQIIIKGIALKISNKNSDKYFNQRPISHKIGAWASKQSSIIPSRDYLDKKYSIWKIFFKNKKIDRPIFWGGYIVKHYNIEFWQGRINRLHDIINYTMINKKWIVRRISP